MTVNIHAASNSSDRDQVLQDLYSNIDILSKFVQATKTKMLAEHLHFDQLHIDSHGPLIHLLIAENAAASITEIVCEEIRLCNRYPGAFVNTVIGEAGTNPEATSKRHLPLLRHADLAIGRISFFRRADGQIELQADDCEYERNPLQSNAITLDVISGNRDAPMLTVAEAAKLRAFLAKWVPERKSSGGRAPASGRAAL